MKKESNPRPPEKMTRRLSASTLEIQKAFTEWERRFREEPERFQSEAEKMLRETPQTYGEACAPYFLQLVGEIQQGK